MTTLTEYCPWVVIKGNNKHFILFGQFIRRDKSHRQALKEKFEPRSIKKKHQLLKHGEVANHNISVNRGLVRLYGFREGEDKLCFFKRI